MLLIVLSAFLALSGAVVVQGPGLAYPALPAYPSLAAPVYPKLAAPVYPALAKVAVAKVAGPEPYDPNPQYSFSYDVHVSQLHYTKLQTKIILKFKMKFWI